MKRRAHADQAGQGFIVIGRVGLISVWRVFSSGRYDVLPAVPEEGN